MTTGDGRLDGASPDEVADGELLQRLANELFRDDVPGTGRWRAIDAGYPLAEPGYATRLDDAEALDRKARQQLADVIGPGHAERGLAASEPDYYFLPRRRARISPPEETFDAAALRRDFPVLRQRIHGRRLVWLDNAATTQKPQAVIDSVRHFYEHDNSNVHRAAHALAARATDAYEGARETVRQLIGAASVREIVFVRGTTEAINLVAQTAGRHRVGPGDEVILTTLEHHSNIVPWQMLCRQTGGVLRVVPISDSGEVLLDAYARLLSPRAKIVAISHVSNALGTVVPVELMTRMAHPHGAWVVVDGAQAVSHFPVDVQAIGCDFYAFSGHKLFGPTGVGALYGRERLLDEIPPWQGGGSMIRTVTFEETTYNDPPIKFEAGTPIIAGAVGLAAAIDYVRRIGLDRIALHEQALVGYATEALDRIPGLRQIGTAPGKAAVLSFVVDGIRSEDLGAALDREGIAVRAGHHCAQPTMNRFGVPSTVRASLALYNTREDVDELVRAVAGARGTLR